MRKLAPKSGCMNGNMTTRIQVTFPTGPPAFLTVQCMSTSGPRCYSEKFPQRTEETRDQQSLSFLFVVSGSICRL